MKFEMAFPLRQKKESKWLLIRQSVVMLACCTWAHIDGAHGFPDRREAFDGSSASNTSLCRVPESAVDKNYPCAPEEHIGADGVLKIGGRANMYRCSSCWDEGAITGTRRRTNYQACCSWTESNPNECYACSSDDCSCRQVASTDQVGFNVSLVMFIVGCSFMVVLICIMFNKSCPYHPERHEEMTGYQGREKEHRDAKAAAAADVQIDFDLEFNNGSPSNGSPSNGSPSSGSGSDSGSDEAPRGTRPDVEEK